MLGQNLFNVGPFYRPVPAIYFATLYTFYGPHAFFYHVIQLGLHIGSTILLFVFFFLFFKKNISFFLSLIFLVHPMNVESVAFIGATDSQLFFLPGITALILTFQKSITKKHLILVFILLLLSSLSKETGLLFVILTLTIRYFFRLGNVKEFLFSSLLLFAFYSLLRVLIAGVTYGLLSPYIPIAQLTLQERLINSPAIFIYYIKTFIFPLSLLVSQEWTVKVSSITGFILPSILSIIFILLCWLVGSFLYKTGKKQKQFIFFTLWFFLGTSILLQIIPLDMTVADRWFLFSHDRTSGTCWYFFDTSFKICTSK